MLYLNKKISVQGGEYLSMENKTSTPQPSNNSLVNSINVSISSIFTSKLVIILVIAVLLGGISGYVFRKKGVSVGGTAATGDSSSSSGVQEVVGSNDTKTFKDTATGTLKSGGIDGEGAYHLVRSGGDSQNVYLTSSIVDLSKFIDKKVKVWGETQKAQVAGWLMDVGRVGVLK